MAWGCEGGQCQGPAKCARHACEHAKKVMEDQGWVMLEEYGLQLAKEVDVTFCRVLEACIVAGVQMQRWIAGWDSKCGAPRFAVWGPRPVVAIINAMSGRDASAKALATALSQAKVNPEFAAGVDAAWRIGGKDAAMAIIAEELPALAREINSTVHSA